MEAESKQRRVVARDERQLQITTDREKLVAGNRAMSQGTEDRQRTTGQMASNGKRRITETVSKVTKVNNRDTSNGQQIIDADDRRSNKRQVTEHPLSKGSFQYL